MHDCNTMKLSHSYSPPPLKQQLSHNNYGIKFHQTNPNIFFTGGRDEIIYLWDMRSPTFYSNYLTGPLICSESLDNSDEKLLTGSWRSKNQIELWDLRRFRKIQDLDWDSSNDSMVQVCKFGKIDSKNVMAAGINGSGVQIFKEEEGIMKIIERFDLEDDADYYTADFSNLNSSDISFGNNKGHLLMFNLLK